MNGNLVLTGFREAEWKEKADRLIFSFIFGGYMQHANQEEVTGYTREELLARIRTSLAGQRNEKRRRLILLRFHFVACGTDTFYSCLYLLGITQIALAHVMYLLCIGGHFFGYGGQLGDILHDLVV